MLFHVVLRLISLSVLTVWLAFSDPVGLQDVMLRAKSNDPVVQVFSSFSMSARAETSKNVTAFDPNQLPSPIADKDYRLTFDDAFASRTSISSGDVHNGAKWYNGVEQCCMSDIGGSHGAMFPTKLNGISVDPYSITESGLNITLSKRGQFWYSGILTSVDKFGQGFSQKYGYFEITAKLPPGPGTWPAFWMKSESNLINHDNLGEIDIFEQYGKFPKAFCTTYHDWTKGTTPYYNCKNSTPDLTEDFHTWGLLWTETNMVVYFDGREINKTVTPPVMQQAYYMILDLGIGGGWPTDQTPESNTMQIRSVRVYAPRTTPGKM